MNQLSLPKVSRKASTQSVKFTDGMLVTAEDLSAATEYPLRLLQVLVRSYFGCGIVCGLDLDSARPAPEPAQGYGSDDQVSATPPVPDEPNFILQVQRGVALDCDGHPIELCDAVKLDLTPDPCTAGTLGADFRLERCIAIRRVNSEEMPKRGCGCDGAPGDSAQPQCSRTADHVQIQVFAPEQLPDGICRGPEPAPPGKDPATGAAQATAVPDLCDCLKACGHCDRCGEGWVLLGCVTITREGLGEVDRRRRLHVKPTRCLCESGARDRALREEVKELKQAVAALKARLDSSPVPQSAPPAGVVPPASPPDAAPPSPPPSVARAAASAPRAARSAAAAETGGAEADAAAATPAPRRPRARSTTAKAVAPVPPDPSTTS